GFPPKNLVTMTLPLWLAKSRQAPSGFCKNTPESSFISLFAASNAILMSVAAVDISSYTRCSGWVASGISRSKAVIDFDFCPVGFSKLSLFLISVMCTFPFIVRFTGTPLGQHPIEPLLTAGMWNTSSLYASAFHEMTLMLLGQRVGVLSVIIRVIFVAVAKLQTKSPAPARGAELL